MEKLTNEEKARRQALAADYRKKANEAWSAKLATLDAEQKAFLQNYNAQSSKLFTELTVLLEKGQKPSDIFAKKFKWLFDGCILKRHKEAFLYIADNIGAFPFTQGWERRTFRSSDLSLYAHKLSTLVNAFTGSNRIDAELADIIEGKLPEEQRAFAAGSNQINSFLLAYEIDNGNARVTEYAKNALESGSDTAISYPLLRGVFMSKNTELHEAVCKLLLAARLQEGLRQAVCECCDEGRIEPFVMLIKTIRDNELIRYSSVKRAAGCWIGLLTPESRDLERISAKTMELIADCLEKPAFRDDCLQSEDSMKLYIALWALACREFGDAINTVERFIESGSAHQAMTAGIFLQNANSRDKQRLAVKAVLTRFEEQDVAAVYLPQISASNSWYANGSERLSPMSSRYDKPTAEKLYSTLNTMLENLPKDREFSPCVFPWNSEALTKSDIVKRLCVVASDLEDDAKIDETCVKIPLIKITDYGSRREQIKMLLSHPKTETQLDTLVSLAGDKEEYARRCVFEILGGCKLSAKHYGMLEDMLRYKAADMRRSLIDVLFRQPEKELYECVKRLVSDKKEEKRTAGLDMILRINESGEWEKHREKYAALAELIESPSSKEQILIEQICGKSAAEEAPALYSDEDSFEPCVDEQFIDECKKAYVKLIPTTRLFGNKPPKKSLGLAEVFTKLDRLIEEHKNDEFLDCRVGETRLLVGSGYSSLMTKDEDGTEHIAFKELWDDFYKTHVNDGLLLFRMSLAMPKSCTSGKLTSVIFGEEFSKDIPLAHWGVIYNVMRYFAETYSDNVDLVPAACALGWYIAREAKKNDLYDIIQSSGYGWYESAELYLDGEKQVFNGIRGKKLVTATTDDRVNIVLLAIGATADRLGSHFKDAVSLRVMMAERFGFFEKRDTKPDNTYASRQNDNYRYSPFDVQSLITAGYRGDISEGYMYKMLMEHKLSDALSTLSMVVSFRRSGDIRARSRYYSYGDGNGFVKSLCGIPFQTKLSEYEFTEEDNKRIKFAADAGENIINAVLRTELSRGDTETKYSRVISSVKRIYGAENFVRILAALGKDTLDRSVYMSSYNGVSKKQSLSHLLGVCVPAEDDTAEKLRGLIKATDVTENRVVEAALFSPAWIDIAEEYLGWKGFRSACYYFIAHMNERLDEKTQAIIAKYSPISAEEFGAGAFDIDWFRDALETVGEARFNKIYAAAKYISDGAKHTRARKYADAVRGKLDAVEAEKIIADKRNKDTLMAYALIPLNGEDEMAKRYLFIQEFKKQAKQFGAQRKASETAASECALVNLSKNAGFSDVSRLTLRMETKLFENVKPLLDWNDIDEIRLKLEIDEDGKTEILCEKGGKPLKAVPAKLKKDERVIAFSDTKKMLTEQYRRTRLMFEEAMENAAEFTAAELELLAANPAIKPIVTRLLYKSKSGLGFLSKGKLTDCAGKETKITAKTALTIAHPFDIYTDGHWHEYQKYLFDNGIAQPFKQIFRELYVKTDEEKTALRSTRYAGNQIQPQKTKACLKTRRWVCDIESGLQKVYYKENIIASIYALADWFSPADIEAPTLEWVEFSDRKTGKPIRIEDVPDIVFSEVMRDVDLAVSVAHAGGVDPETSHSTIEMRSAIAEFTLPLFKLDNVRLEKSHAFITGKRADYSIHLGSGVVHIQGGPMINVLPVHSQHRGKLFLPFVDEDPKTAQIISEILLFAEDPKIKDPFILEQIK